MRALVGELPAVCGLTGGGEDLERRSRRPPMASAKTHSVLLLGSFLLLLSTCSGKGGGGGRNGTRVDLRARAAEVGTTEMGSGGITGCDGPMGECLAEEEELLLDSEVNRRLFAATSLDTSHTSYAALSEGRAPYQSAETAQYAKGCNKNVYCNCVHGPGTCERYSDYA